jgi:hypothetical protein
VVRISNASVRQAGRRGATLSVVLLVHGALLLAFLTAPVMQHARREQHETVITFPVPPPPRSVPGRRAAQSSAPRPYTVPQLTLPPDMLVRPNAPTTLDLPLADCAPESLGGASHKACSITRAFVPNDNAPQTIRNRSVQSTRWAATLAARRSPVRVDCMNIVSTIGRMPGTAATAIMPDPLCVLERIRKSKPLVETYSTHPN